MEGPFSILMGIGSPYNLIIITIHNLWYVCTINISLCMYVLFICINVMNSLLNLKNGTLSIICIYLFASSLSSSLAHSQRILVLYFISLYA